MVLDGILRPPREQARDIAPRVAVLFLRAPQDLLLVVRPHLPACLYKTAPEERNRAGQSILMLSDKHSRSVREGDLKIVLLFEFLIEKGKDPKTLATAGCVL